MLCRNGKPRPVEKARSRSERLFTRMKTGFTLIELLIVTSIIAILASLLFPTFAAAKQTAQKSDCLTRLRQTGIAWQLYSTDADEVAPPSYYFLADGTEVAWDFRLSGQTSDPEPGLLSSYLHHNSIHSCPTFRGKGWGRPTTGYGYNTGYLGGEPDMGVACVSLAALDHPAETVAFAECGWGQPVTAANYLRPPSDPLFLAGKVHFRHLGHANAVWADGHCSAPSSKGNSEEPELGSIGTSDWFYGGDR